MHSIKAFLAKYAATIWALLKPLGAWGVFAIAGIDAALFGMPLDPVVAGYVYTNRSMAWLYVLMASAGSALGCIVLYVVGYKGGEVLLEKRISKEKFQKMRASFERNQSLTLILPAMMPPGFPFKLFVLAAAVFEMDFWHFLGAIFLGRLIRFTILTVLVLLLGPHIVELTARLLRAHLVATLGSVIALILAAILWQRSRSKRNAQGA